MNKKSQLCLLWFCSDNLKSKIQNLKWWGIFATVFAFAFGGVEALAQQPKKLARIGYLSARDSAAESVRAEAIRLALREIGYVEGQNITTDYRYAKANLERLPELTAELVRLKVDVIVVTGGDPDLRAAKNATTTIPIVMVGSGTDPVEAGFIQSLARPGGNVTGITNLAPELSGKRLELLKEAVPGIDHVAVLYDPSLPSSVLQVKEHLPIAARAHLPIAARALKLIIQPWEIRAAEDFDKVFAALNKERVDGLFVTGGPMLNSNHKRSVGLALKSRLPLMCQTKETLDAGGLLYYGADVVANYRRVAYYVDKILKGAKPGDLPVEQPKKFEFIINLKTAKQIGLTIPSNVLARADRVIK